MSIPFTISCRFGLPFTTQDNKRQLFRLLQKIAREADHIVTVSENSKRDIIELLGVEEKRITNTYQTVEFPQEWIDRPVAAVASQLEGYVWSRLHDYLLFYGALEPKKNVRRLIDAYLISGVEVPLVIVVGGGWQNEAELQLLARQCGGEPGGKPSRRRIHRLDYVSRSNLVTLIRGARAVVFPSLYEGFGLPVLEAMVARHAGRSVAQILAARDRRRCRPPRRSLRHRCTSRARSRRSSNDGDLRAELSRRGAAQAAKFSVDRYRDRVGALYAALR